jgi:branched-chain amino acid transport system ATP-binding protein
MSEFLSVQGVQASYGHAQALFDISFSVGTGEVVTLLGRNGMGKTTTVRAVMGLMPVKSGSIAFGGAAIAGLPAYKVAKAGLGLVPEGRQIFPNLSVHENLVATARAPANGTNGEPWTLDRVYGLFPRLRERAENMGNQLSGGEQQMLAVGRALMTNPRLLILDEATEGLAPLVRAQIWECLAALKREGHAILVVDKVVDALLRLADRHVILERGRVAWAGTSDEFAADRSVREAFLAV